LLSEGVRDVCIVPMFTKKNRPGHIVKVIVDKEDVERISRILMEETGTLGVRIIPCSRHILAREIISVEIDTELGKETVRLKVAKDSRGKILHAKPEYDDIKRLAEKLNKPLKEIIKLVMENIRGIKSTKES